MESSITTRYGPVTNTDALDAEDEPNTKTICRTATCTREQSSESPREIKAKIPTRRHQLRFWRWEALSLVLALGCVVAMAAIPAYYDGATVDEWPVGINLSTVIALLTISMRAAMLVAVAEVLGQMKWRFFDRPRPLADIQNFDHASRSVLGSAKLLWVARSSTLSTLAALITILSMAVGPFTQQAAGTVPCQRIVPGARASLPIAHYFPGLHRSLLEDIITSSIKGAVLNALVNTATYEQSIQFTCETGNCTFPTLSSGVTHSSIGICSACFDTSRYIVLRRNYTLPNGQTIQSAGQVVSVKTQAEDLEWAKDAFPAGFAAIARIALSNTTVLSSNRLSCRQGATLDACGIATSMSCSLYACVKNFHAQVTRGELRESIVSTQPAVTGLVDKDSSSYNNTLLNLQLPCLLDGVEYSLHNTSQPPPEKTELVNVDGTTHAVPEACIYGLYKPWAEGFSEFVASEILNGTYHAELGRGRWWLESLGNNGNTSLAYVTDTFDRIATTVTNIFRETGTKDRASFLKGLYYWNGVSRVDDLAVGSVIGTTVCTRFDWRWVLLPIVLVCATAILLLAAIVQSWREPNLPVWKTSVLPLIFYGVGSSDGGTSSALDLDELRAHAESVTARFRTGPNTGFEKELED
ncbi:hypothetical protein CPLU01_13171 [Colletotrichum plurivorum]|uniref:Uncharacterized protein n=1 Tax=Colletotrichum plurivorum TaxID=2175906 RepID=A0A8H6N3D9_9PEZI|nr:hypothetical protein CPLU01_13171 [Colletotrichum plurivorum]